MTRHLFRQNVTSFCLKWLIWTHLDSFGLIWTPNLPSSISNPLLHPGPRGKCPVSSIQAIFPSQKKLSAGCWAQNGASSFNSGLIGTSFDYVQVPRLCTKFNLNTLLHPDTSGKCLVSCFPSKKNSLLAAELKMVLPLLTLPSELVPWPG